MADEPRSFRRGREAVALLLFFVALYLLLALASLRVDAEDSSVSGPNWVGPVGAEVGALLARAFGALAWAFPLELLLVGAPLFKRRDPDLSGLRLAGDLVVVIVLSSLLHIAAPDSPVFGNVRVGGDVGLIFGELFSALFSTAGSFLVGLLVVTLILVGRADFSFIELCGRSSEILTSLWRAAGRGLTRLQKAWAEARALRLSEQTLEQEQARPKIDSKPSDEAILHQLAEDDEWIPLERTGQPPLAVAESLRRHTLPDPAALSPVPPALSPTPSPEAAKPEVEAANAAPPAAVPATVEKASAVPAGGETVSVEPPVVSTAPPPSVVSKPKPSAALEEKPGAGEELRIVDTRQFAEVERGRSGPRRPRGKFKLPETSLLDPPQAETISVDRDRVFELAERLERTLLDYGVTGKVEEVHPGPTVTTYEVSPEAGTKVSKVASLCDDLALGLSRKVRIIAPIPGKARIGFELPNDERIPVNLRELIEDRRFETLSAKAALPVVLGRDIVGAPFYADLASMPHVIVAGSTGAGKSVGLNVMLSSLLFQRTPDELRLLMIDPKVVELAPFDGIPHMLLPVVTDMKQAAKALKWAVDEMEKRYQAFALAGTKNITTYNLWIDKVHAGELPPPRPEEVQALTAEGAVVSVPAAKTGADGAPLPGRMPHIVVVVDEFADLIMQQGKEVEAAVARLAQKARASGMHVVLATQRPSVDVITGMIKANFPTRIAYRVAQKVDSRTILDEMGAELLLGRGDMLVKLNGASETYRVQCPFVSEEEVSALTDYLRTQGSPEYCDDILRGGDDEEASEAGDQNLDPRYDEAVRVVAETQRCSTSWLQRKMTVGYNRAAKIVEAMEQRGVIGPANGSKEREIFVHPQ